MRYWYVNNQREKVFKGSSLLVLALIAVIILVAIQPREGAFRGMLSSLEPNAVALNYARVLVALSPEDAELKALLAQQYANLGRLAEADAVLIGLGRQSMDVRHTLLHLSILRQRLFASTDPTFRRKLQTRVIGVLQTLDVNALPHEAREEVAGVALAFEQPLIAARIYAGLFVATRDPRWAMRAAHHFEAAEQPSLAATAYARASTVPGAHVEDAIQQALRLYQAASDFAAGIAYLSEFDPARLPVSLHGRAATFALAANAPELAGGYARLLAEADQQGGTGPPLDAVSFVDLMHAALAVQDLDTAVHWAKRAVGRAPSNIDLRQQLAQVLEWRGDTHEALEQWRWLAKQSPGKAQADRTWQLARSAYRTDVVAEILTAKGKLGPLNAAELDAWLNALIAEHSLGATMEHLRRYVEQHAEDEHAWRAGARLLADNESFQDALDWWREVGDRFALRPEDQQQMAALHWQLFDLPAALAALQQVPEEAVTYNPEYWRDVGKLAHLTGQAELANDAYTRLAAFDELSPQEYDVLFETMADVNNDYRYHANRAWELTGAVRFLLKAMETEFHADADRFERLLRVAEQHRNTLKRNPLFWTLKGQHMLRKGQPDAAGQHFETALALAPNYAPAVGHYARLLAEQRNLTRLWQLLDRRPELALGNPQLFTPFAQGYAALARYDEAAFWYRKAVAESPDDTYLALEFTEALMRTGRVDEALHWRRDTLRRALANLPGIDGVDISALRTLSAGMLSRPDFEQLVYRINGADPAQIVRTLINDQLDNQAYDAARFWVAYAKRNDIQLDDYPHFMMAHQGRDIDALEPFKSHLRPTMRAEALLASEEDTRALLTALTQINTRTPESDRLMLTRMAADISFNRPSGAQTTAEQRDFGTVTTTTARVSAARTLDRLSVSAEAAATSYTFDEQLVADAATELRESQLHVRVSGISDAINWEAAAGSIQSDAGNLTPLAFSAQRQWDQRHSTTARLAFAQKPDETPLLQAFGQKNSASVSHTWRPTARDTFSAQLSAEHFADRAGESISSGYRAEIGWQHSVFFERPAVVARVAAGSARRSAPERTRSLASQISDLAFGDLLPERTDRIGLGLTVSHGEPGRMNWRVPSPRYRLDFDVGYQWPENKPTYEVSASVGTRVFGDDELALTASYASRPDLGLEASGYALALTYNYRLGR